MTDSNSIKVSNRIADNLVTRRAADELFDFIESARQKRITLDFKGVNFASRSFAHEYLTNMNNTDKIIIAKNVPERVKKMFDAVKKQGDKPVSFYHTNFRSMSLATKGFGGK